MRALVNVKAPVWLLTVPRWLLVVFSIVHGLVAFTEVAQAHWLDAFNSFFLVWMALSLRWWQSFVDGTRAEVDVR